MSHELKQKADEVAVVVDNHTGRIRAHYVGLGAAGDAASFARQCKAGKVDCMSSISVVTGTEAAKILKNGRT